MCQNSHFFHGRLFLIYFDENNFLDNKIANTFDTHEIQITVDKEILMINITWNKGFSLRSFIVAKASHPE